LGVQLFHFFSQETLMATKTKKAAKKPAKKAAKKPAKKK